jgi:hypothetical protein
MAIAGKRPGDNRLGSRPLFFFPSPTAEPFSRKPVQKRVTYRDNLVLSLDFSRAAGDMGLETGSSLSSSPGARGRSKRTVIVVLTVWCHFDEAPRNIVAVVWRDFRLMARRPRRRWSQHVASNT